MKHVVMYSGGVGSWAAAMRVAQKYETEDLILLFTDTKKKSDQHPHHGEDQDLYRFLQEGATACGGQLEWISRGKHIWQTFEDNRYMGNSRVDPCSRELKREMAREWMEKHFPNPEEVTIYIGIDWTETHRIESNAEAWKPYRVEFPMCEKPYLTKQDMLHWCESSGVKRPRLYELGFHHNNCGGFCVKAGTGQFYNLLKSMPERYAYHEFKQEELFQILGKRVPFLRQTIKGETQYLSLKEFREKIESGGQIDLFDLGGCGCFSDVDEPLVVAH